MKHVQLVHELFLPLSVEAHIEHDRLTVRVWEHLAEERRGTVTGRHYLQPIQKHGTQTNETSTVRMNAPVGGYEVIDGHLFGMLDEIALDPSVIRQQSRKYGNTWTDFGAWMFILTTDTWRLMTPFNRHIETHVSKIDSEGFTAISLAMTKARMGHLVVASLLVPWAHQAIDEGGILRINAHPQGCFWSNFKPDETIRYHSHEQVSAGHSQTIDSLHQHLPKLEVACTQNVAPDGWVEFLVQCSDDVDATLHVEALSGYCPKRRWAMRGGRAVVKAFALGLERGDLLDMKFGFGPVSGLARGVIHVN